MTSSVSWVDYENTKMYGSFLHVLVGYKWNGIKFLTKWSVDPFDLSANQVELCEVVV